MLHDIPPDAMSVEVRPRMDGDAQSGSSSQILSSPLISACPSTPTRPAATRSHLAVGLIEGLLLIHRLKQNCGENRLKLVLAPKKAASQGVMLFGMRETGRSGMSTHGTELIRLAPTPKNVLGDVDQLDKAGETILRLVQKAAGVAEQNSSRALSMAQKFSDQLRAAEDRIAELESESATYRERADRAEQWLRTVYTEIEDRFFRYRDDRGRMRA
jgi:hypothetical protein